MKWYNVELFPAEAVKLKMLLRGLLVKFETSACYNLAHFEILLDPDGDEIKTINKFLEKGSI